MKAAAEQTVRHAAAMISGGLQQSPSSKPRSCALCPAVRHRGRQFAEGHDGVGPLMGVGGGGGRGGGGKEGEEEEGDKGVLRFLRSNS